MNKKDIIIWSVVAVFIGLIIIFLPKINDIITHKARIGVGKEEETKVEEIKTYLCTVDVNDKLVSKTTQVEFTFESKIVDKRTTKTTYNYKSKNAYNEAKGALVKDVATEEYTTKTTLDEKNNVIIIQSIESGSKLIGSEYSNDYDELLDYLSEHKYICTAK